MTSSDENKQYNCQKNLQQQKKKSNFFFALFGRLLFVCELCNCVSTCRSTRLYKKDGSIGGRWTFNPFLWYTPTFRHLHVKIQHVYHYKKLVSTCPLMSEKRKHESRHFNSFVFYQRGEKTIAKQMSVTNAVLLFKSGFYLSLSLCNKSSLACFEEHEWQFKLEKKRFFSVDDTIIIILLHIFVTRWRCFRMFSLKIENYYKIGKFRKYRQLAFSSILNFTKK